LLQSAAKRTRALDWERLGFLYARIALGAAFLSGIADRFGLYWGRNVGYGNFDGFMQYTAKVNSFMPPATIPFLAWAATAGELFFGIALILGIGPAGSPSEAPCCSFCLVSPWPFRLGSSRPWIIRSSLRQARQSY